MKKYMMAGVALCLFSALAQAQTAIDKGDFIVRGGVAIIDPESDGLSIDLGAGPQNLSADSATGVTFNLEYMFTRNIGLELLAALPYKHDLQLDGTTIGETKQLPPTLSVKWHQPIGQIVPYVGLGVNWTVFFDEKLDGGNNVLALDDSLGIAAQIGFDYVFSNNWLVNVDVRYISIETDAVVGGTLAGGGAAAIGTVDINPWVYGVNVGYKF
ncbi:MAG: OmpW/AlkL family protein [Gammaproteobacteria bacterium]